MSGCMKTQIPLIYNLFPRLAGKIKDWIYHLDRIRAMGFNWIYINPFHYTGFSGSLYAVKDYYSINPLFVDEKSNLHPFDQLKNFIDEAHKRDIKVMMDLVINHTAKDHPFTSEFPYWYKRKENGEIKSPGAWDNGKWIEWGDLAELDHNTSVEKEKLWNYFKDVIFYYVSMGFDGFRADAAYAVPENLWNFLISETKAKYRNVYFFAESLGCSFEDTLKLAKNGFDYIFNSSKWWNYKDSWLIEQYNAARFYSPSISFPESHDTERISVEYKGNLDLIKQRIAFTCFFSAGWMIPLGLEYGFRKKLDVCRTQPSDWEEEYFDLTDFIESLIKSKISYKALYEEWEIKNFIHRGGITYFEKVSNTKAAFFFINTLNKELIVDKADFSKLNKRYRDVMNNEVAGKIINLKPFDFKCFLEL